MKKMIIILVCLVFTGCASYRAEQRELHCLPGSKCFDKLPPQQQEIKREKWLGQRQRMLDYQDNVRNPFQWIIRPITSY